MASFVDDRKINLSPHLSLSPLVSPPGLADSGARRVHASFSYHLIDGAWLIGASSIRHPARFRFHVKTAVASKDQTSLVRVLKQTSEPQRSLICFISDSYSTTDAFETNLLCPIIRAKIITFTCDKHECTITRPYRL
jgi:hypothetical protein